MVVCYIQLHFSKIYLFMQIGNLFFLILHWKIVNTLIIFIIFI